MTEDQKFLLHLAQFEIERISTMQSPVVRVCGPLTCDGEAGYQRNADRLEAAEEILEQRGYTVWKFGDSEKYIQGRNFDHDDIINYFHQPIMESGKLAAAFFLPRWKESGGAVKERLLAEKIDVTIEEFPEDWFKTAM